MIYIVGTGVNSMKDNFIYAYPQSKMSKKQFHAKKSLQVIDIASGNLYLVDAEVVQEEQMFGSLPKAISFASQDQEKMKINVNIAKYLLGVFSDANIRDIFYSSKEVSVKVEEALAEIAKPANEVIASLKSEISEYEKNLNLMQSKVLELSNEAHKAVEELKSNLPSMSFNSQKYEWNDEDFLKITKLNQKLAELVH